MNNSEKIVISNTFGYVYSKALYYCKLSDGMYDITVSPLINLWGFFCINSGRGGYFMNSLIEYIINERRDDEEESKAPKSKKVSSASKNSKGS